MAQTARQTHLTQTRNVAQYGKQAAHVHTVVATGLSILAPGLLVASRWLPLWPVSRCGASECQSVFATFRPSYGGIHLLSQGLLLLLLIVALELHIPQWTRAIKCSYVLCIALSAYVVLCCLYSFIVCYICRRHWCDTIVLDSLVMAIAWIMALMQWISFSSYGVMTSALRELARLNQ